MRKYLENVLNITRYLLYLWNIFVKNVQVNIGKKDITISNIFAKNIEEVTWIRNY